MKICHICRYCYDDAEKVCARGDHGELAPSRHGTRFVTEKYRLDRLLGRGGMGAVYAGMHVELDRPTAIKLVLPDLVSDLQALERFRREARAAARLNHPNVVDTYDYGLLPGGEAYIVMELVEGQTLREYMNAAQQLPLAEAVDIARQVADGIEAAHRGGIIHRDLKPSNIILSRDHHDSFQAKVMDFGIAKLKEQTTTSGALTNTGSLVGTPRYMSPEQCAGDEIDARSDIYSLGVILYEMLADRPPFDAATATAVALKHVQEAPTPVRELRPEMPEALSALVMQALEKIPAERPQTAAEYARGLRAVHDDLPRPVEAVAEAGRLTSSPDAAPATHSDLSKGTTPSRDAATGGHSGGGGLSTGRAGVPTAEATQGVPPPPARADEPAEGSRTPPPDAETVQSSPADTIQSGSGAPSTAGPDSRERGTTPPPPTPSSQPHVGARRPGARRPTSPLIYALVGMALLLGVGALMFSRRGWNPTAGGPVTGESPASASVDSAPSPTTAAPPATPTPRAGQPTPSPIISEEELVEPPADERRELRAALSGWVRATNARSIRGQMDYYAPQLKTFYLARDVSRAAVKAEKEGTFSQARRVEVKLGEPVIRLGRDGRTAVTRFRKQYLIESGGQSRSGEVLQELGWVKQGGGWRINSERDIQVIR